MKDTKVIEVTIRQLLIILLVVSAIIITGIQINNARNIEVSKDVDSESGTIKEELAQREINEVANLVKASMIIGTEAHDEAEKTAMATTKRNLEDNQVVTRSSLLERQADATTQQESSLEAQQDIGNQAEQVEIQQNVATSEQTVETPQAQLVEATAQYKSINEIVISKDMDLTMRTGISKEDFKTLISKVKQDKTKFFYENSDIIYDVCEQYQINEVFFCGLIATESGWDIVDSHRKTHNYISLMSKGKLIRYSSVEEGLQVAAQRLHENYLSEGGKYYNGTTLAGVKVKFCPKSSTWVNLVYSGMEKIVNN